MNPGLESLGEEILKTRNLLLTVDAEILLPRIGGYNAMPYSAALRRWEPPRPSELKALWRWWMRVALSAAYGCSENYKKLDEVVGRILGSQEEQSCFTLIVEPSDGGDSLSKVDLLKQLLDPEEGIVIKTAENLARIASERRIECRIVLTPPLKFRAPTQKRREFLLQLNISEKDLRIDSSKKLEKIARSAGQSIPQNLLEVYDSVVEASNIARLRLLLQPRREEGEDNEFRGKVSESNKKYLSRIVEELAFLFRERLPVKILVLVNRKLDDTLLRFSISTLFLALVLGGHGSITRRGFGSIVVRNCEASEERHRRMLGDEIRMLRSIQGASNGEDLKRRLDELVRRTVELAKLARSVIEGERALTAPPSEELPKVPTLAPDRFFRIEVFECPGRVGPAKLLEAIGEATLKATWKTECRSPVTTPGENFHTWILGLPRRVGRTGYFVGSEGGRRISAIGFKIFENARGRKFVIVYGFLSRDWPLNEMRHRGRNAIVRNLDIMKRLSAGRPPTCDLVKVQNMNDERFLSQVFDAAFEFVTAYLKRRLREICGGF